MANAMIRVLLAALTVAICSVGAPPTVINAILDALRPLGVEHIDMPATPARIWDAVRGASSGA